MGQVAARDISGTVSLDTRTLELLDFPGLDAYELRKGEEESHIAAEVGTIGELLPGYRDTFKIALTVHRELANDTALTYSFITPAGFRTSGEYPL